MGRLLVGLVVAVLVITVGGMAYLMFADVAAPVAVVEQVVPNDRLAQQ